jgi:hypothetical protein
LTNQNRKACLGSCSRERWSYCFRTRVKKYAETSTVDSPTFQSKRSVFSTTRTFRSGRPRFKRIAVEAPATAPPMTTTS